MSFGDQTALMRAARGDAALCTIVGIDGSFSRRLGAQLAVAENGECMGDLADNCLHVELAEQAKMARKAGSPQLLRYGQGSPFIDFRLPCGAGLDILVDPSPDVTAMERVIETLAGRQPAALPLPIPEDRAGLLRARRYLPDLQVLAIGNGSECGALTEIAEAHGVNARIVGPEDGIAMGERPHNLLADHWTAVALMFHEHEWEFALLDWALDSDAFYIGALGGAETRRSRHEKLAAAGRSEAELDRIASPMGLIPGTRSAQLLSLSAFAEIAGQYEVLHNAP